MKISANKQKKNLWKKNQQNNLWAISLKQTLLWSFIFYQMKHRFFLQILCRNSFADSVLKGFHSNIVLCCKLNFFGVQFYFVEKKISQIILLMSLFQNMTNFLSHIGLNFFSKLKYLFPKKLQNIHKDIS